MARAASMRCSSRRTKPLAGCPSGERPIYALMASGALASVTIGRCRRVPVSSLQAFVARLVDNASVDGSNW